MGRETGMGSRKRVLVAQEATRRKEKRRTYRGKRNRDGRREEGRTERAKKLGIE